jgi:lysyl-tRNA synthetase class 2
MLRAQFELVQIIRNFFQDQDFIDVITPPAVENPGMEVHIHPFQLHSVHKKALVPLYLHTSPEFCMKEILASDENFDRIFNISYCFRDEPESPIHRPQFLMLEWYRKNQRYETIMQDINQLLDYVKEKGSQKGLNIRPEFHNKVLVTKTMQDIFFEFLNIDILDYLDVPKIKKLLHQFPEVPVPEINLEWEDYFFLLYLNLIEPRLKSYPLLLIKEFPAPLCALSTLKKEDPRVCERFEVYINGIEICNCFNELTDLIEQRKRFDEQSSLKKKLYNYELPPPQKFYSTLNRGLPASSGVALGVERLLHALFEIDNPFYS